MAIRYTIDSIKKTLQKTKDVLISDLELNPSQEHFAETVIKLERVVFNKRRPPAFGRREVSIRLLDPINIGVSLDAYKKDPSTTSKKIAEELRARIQAAITKIP